MYHSIGFKSKPWEFWFEITAVNEKKFFPTEPDEDDEDKQPRGVGCNYPTVEVGVSAHYLPERENKCNTNSLENLRKNVSSWITLTCMESLYEHYLF